MRPLTAGCGFRVESWTNTWTIKRAACCQQSFNVFVLPWFQVSCSMAVYSGSRFVQNCFSCWFRWISSFSNYACHFALRKNMFWLFRSFCVGFQTEGTRCSDGWGGNDGETGPWGLFPHRAVLWFRFFCRQSTLWWIQVVVACPSYIPVVPRSREAPTCFVLPGFGVSCGFVVRLIRNCFSCWFNFPVFRIVRIFVSFSIGEMDNWLVAHSVRIVRDRIRLRIKNEMTLDVLGPMAELGHGGNGASRFVRTSCSLVILSFLQVVWN